VKQLETTSRKYVAELEQIRPIAQKAAINLEKIHSLETQLSLMEDLRKRATEMEIEIAMLRKEKLAWNTFLESNEGNRRPEEISRELHQERAANKSALERIQALESELSQTHSKIRTAEESVENLRTEVQAKQEQLVKTERRYERLERQKNLAQREVQFLKEQLKTYDSEETVFFNGAGVDAQKAAKIESLEKMVEQYKSELDRVNKEGPLPGIVTENGKRKRPEITEDDEESRRKIRVLQNGNTRSSTTNLDLTKSRQSEALLQKDITSLKSQLESLEKVVKISRTRVLELKDNPAARHEAVQKKHLDQLTSENTALLQRIQGKGIGVPKETIERMKGELERMEALVAQKEKRMMRLKEVSQTADFN
jgi:mitotic spindle assembly checkpoint protein MAD1